MLVFIKGSSHHPPLWPPALLPLHVARLSLVIILYRTPSTARINFDDDENRDMDFSDDKVMLPDKPTFTGLFRPSLFKYLLHKAIVTTQLATSQTQADQQGDPNPHEALFAIPKAEREFIPCPQLFTEMIQRPWAQPRSLAALNGLDKKL